jgi:uncharacterized membrane protein YraQ (UPF0718 family)
MYTYMLAIASILSSQEALEQKNAALFWGLVILCLLIAAVVIAILICYCCPGCYLYKHE